MLLSAAFAARATARSVWELTPYRVQLFVAAAPEPELAAGPTADDLPDELADRINALVGAPWELSVEAAPADLRRKMIRDIESVVLDSLPEGCLDCDKVILLTVVPTANGHRVAARELDVRTRLWGTLVSRPVWQRAKLRDVMLGAV